MARRGGRFRGFLCPSENFDVVQWHRDTTSVRALFEFVFPAVIVQANSTTFSRLASARVGGPLTLSVGPAQGHSHLHGGGRSIVLLREAVLKGQLSNSSLHCL